MDELFPPRVEQAERQPPPDTLHDWLQPGLFVPLTPDVWRELQAPHPEITQL